MSDDRAKETRDTLNAKFQWLLDNTTGLKGIRVDDPVMLRVASLQALLESELRSKALLRRKVSNAESLAAKYRNLNSELGRKLSQSEHQLQEVTKERNYLQLIVTSHDYTDETAKEILLLRQWCTALYFAMTNDTTEAAAKALEFLDNLSREDVSDGQKDK